MGFGIEGRRELAITQILLAEDGKSEPEIVERPVRYGQCEWCKFDTGGGTVMLTAPLGQERGQGNLLVSLKDQDEMILYTSGSKVNLKRYQGMGRLKRAVLIAPGVTLIGADVIEDDGSGGQISNFLMELSQDEQFSFEVQGEEGGVGGRVYGLVVNGER